MSRIFALIIIALPGVLAVIGIKLMRDSLFAIVHPLFGALWIQLIAGILFFLVGLAFVAGFILHRDRNRNLIKGRFKK